MTSKTSACRKPNKTNEPFTVKSSSVPNEAWTTDKLTAFAQKQIEQMATYEKKVAVHVRRLGHALKILRDPKRGSYTKRLKSLRISVPTAWRATELFRRTKSEEEVAGLGITEAYIKYGIVRRSPEQEGDEKSPQKKGKAAPKTAKEKGGKEVAKAAAHDHEDTEEAERASQTSDVAQEEDGTEEPDAAELFEQAAKEKGWSEQQQIEMLLKFWEEESLGLLMAGVEDIEEMREFLTGLDAPTPPAAPPPPEDLNSPLVVLTKISSRLDMLGDEIKSVDWTKQSKDDYRCLLEDIILTAQQIREEVANA
jgi:hypothetical protein